MAFKIPLVKTKSLSKGYLEDLTNFEWSDVRDKDENGKGSFGSVMKGTYAPKGKVVVVKRVFGEGDSYLKNVAKEAKMLESLCHPNIAQFIGVCSKPVAIMMEYECFDFSPFGLDHQISNLLEFLHTLDRIEGETEAFEHFSPVFPKAAKDVAAGLCFLHSKNVVHRDLKPGNVLVSNRHYSKKDISADRLRSVFIDCPVVCKLTDFGESRSTLLQTASIIHAKTTNIKRGTKPYMAPEIILEGKLNCATMEDLKAIDIWALGMTFFSIINPDVEFPYEIELNSNAPSQAAPPHRSLPSIPPSAAAGAWHSGLSPHLYYLVALPKNVKKCYGCSDNFAEKFRQPPHNIVVKHVDRRVVCRDDNTGALVYSTDFTNTYYHPSPAHIMRKNPVFDGRVHVDFSTYHSLDASQKEMLQQHGLIVNIVNYQ